MHTRAVTTTGDFQRGFLHTRAVKIRGEFFTGSVHMLRYGLVSVRTPCHTEYMNKREYIKNLTPGDLFTMDGANGTVYEAVRVISMSPYTSVTYIVAGDTQPRESTFSGASLSTCTLV